MDHWRLLAIAGLVFLGVSCATAMYQGDKKPDNEVATIKTDGTKVEKIDGRFSAISRCCRVSTRLRSCLTTVPNTRHMAPDTGTRRQASPCALRYERVAPTWPAPPMLGGNGVPSFLTRAQPKASQQDHTIRNWEVVRRDLWPRVRHRWKHHGLRCCRQALLQWATRPKTRAP